MATQKPNISETEMEVLRVLWDEGPLTVRALNEFLRGLRRRWAYTTVQTLLARLEDKGYVARDDRGVAHVFRAAVTRDKLLRWRLRELADQVCGGAATPLMMNLVKGHRFSAEDLESFQRVLDEQGADGGSKSRASSKGRGNPKGRSGGS